MTRGREVDADAVKAYGRLGVDRLVPVVPFASSMDGIETFLRDHAPERLGAT